jgi:hypothetical protein
MFHSLCGVAVACAVGGQTAAVVGPTTAVQSPPRVVEVEQQGVMEPGQPGVVRSPAADLDQDNDQDSGCEEYNCIGPRTEFRLPDEVPYFYYEQQYRRLPPGG